MTLQKKPVGLQADTACLEDRLLTRNHTDGQSILEHDDAQKSTFSWDCEAHETNKNHCFGLAQVALIVAEPFLAAVQLCSSFA